MVYKICILGKDNKIKQIIVQKPSENQEISLFSESEQKFIESNAIPVVFSSQQIHRDDSISTVKNKILKDLEFSISYHELYLFSNIKKNHKSLQSIFENISGKTDYINLQNFQQLLINFGISSKVSETFPETKTKFFLDDFLSLESELLDESTYYKQSIGKRFRLVHNELFSANPYDILEGTKIIQTSTNPIETYENQLLLNNNNGEFIQDIIYVCFAEDVLDYCEEIGLDGDHVTSYYFPLLRRKDIVDNDMLQKSRNELIKETKKRASKHLFETYESVDLFYDIYENRLSDLPYVARGANVVSFFIHPEFKHILPLDIIFKNVHATKMIPFIKYNPGSRRENIYRFYTESITKYGTKIPFLPARTILKLAKETGKNKQISFSVESPRGDFYIDILNNGDIHIAGNNFREPMTIEGLNVAFQEIVNPVISHMNDFLKKNGYELLLFKDLRDPNIEIEYMNYVFHMKLTKEIDMAKYKNWLQPIFESSEDADIHSGATLRYKRVENYNEMSEEDIFISGLFGQNKSREEIVGILARKYEINIPDSILRLSQFLRDHEQQHGRFVNNSIKIAESPGFLVTMQIKSYDDLFICEIALDNSSTDVYLGYIDSFFVYIDGILRITQQPKSTSIPQTKVARIIKKETYVEKERFDNVVTGIEAIAVGVMIDDAIEDEEPINETEIRQTAFGDLDDFENADIDEDNLVEYEEEFESLSSLPDSGEEKSQSSEETLTPLPQSSEEKSQSSEESLTPLPQSSEEKPLSGEESLTPLPQSESSKKSSSSSDNGLMYAAEEEEDNESSKKSSSSSDNGLMYAAEEDSKGGAPKRKTEISKKN